jgi:hypothetical protein
MASEAGTKTFTSANNWATGATAAAKPLWGPGLGLVYLLFPRPSWSIPLILFTIAATFIFLQFFLERYNRW